MPKSCICYDFWSIKFIYKERPVEFIKGVERMGKKSLIKKVTALAIITVFFTTSILPTISGIDIETNEKQNIITQKPEEVEKKVTVTCYNFGMPGEPSKEIEIPQHEAEYLYEKIKELNFAVASDPLSERTQQLQIEIIDLADEYDLLPTGLSKNLVKEQLVHKIIPQTNRMGFLPQTQSKASEFLCTFVSSGSGGVLPIIALPRVIPILMIPIPRLLMIWRAQEAVTSCGGLRSGTGFIAYGQQNGIALGFWGLGFTFSLPPLMGVYGLAGYALFATVDADVIEFYPPNSPPVISQIDPGDGEINVPLSLSELRFQISDWDGDLMSYTVTTTPDIGSGSGNLKPDGVYSVPISGLEDLTDYSWHIEVTDGMDTTIDDFTFTTEAIAPIVSNPSPQDDERYVPVSLSHLSFHLKDFQGDPMDYTVETVPDIGSGSGTGVGEGTYFIPVSGLDYSSVYTWHVNVTDGDHWTRKKYCFETEYPSLFNPFNEGWMYRKQITIHHEKVAGDLINFPVLIDYIDPDLRDKAQDDGDDILFMDGDGVAKKLHHEIEKYEKNSGELIAWVNCSTYSSKDSVFYLYYGNENCLNKQDIEDTWDSNYVGVWHMSEPSGNIVDSTGTKNGFVSGSPSYQQSAPIGNGVYFDGENSEYFDITDDMYKFYDEDATLEIWVYYSQNRNKYENAISLGKTNTWYPTLMLYKYRSGYGDPAPIAAAQAGLEGSPTEYGESDEGYETVGRWLHQVGRFERDAETSLFINGVKQAITSDCSDVRLDEGNFGAFIGKSNYVYGQYQPQSMHGYIDEVRISKNIARSPAWISTEYTNQNDPSGFYSVGPEIPAP